MNSGALVEPQTLDAVREFKERLEQRFGDRVKAVYLFGSRARGDHEPDSDVDVAAFFQGPVESPYAFLGQMSDDAIDLMLKHGVVIFMVPFDEGSLIDPDAYYGSHLVREVLRDGVRI